LERGVKANPPERFDVLHANVAAQMVRAGERKMSERRILNSWKEIANYLGRGVRTVQRWEAQLGLPVHRPAGKDHSAVLAFSSELDQWLDSRPLRHATDGSAQPANSEALQLQTLLARTEVVLQRLEALVARADESHRKLAQNLEVLAENEAVRRELRAVRSRRVEAGAA